jgi:beta-lactamase superfamily II metal-dependent hydrolase
VMRISFGEVSFLLAANAGRNAENGILISDVAMEHRSIAVDYQDAESASVGDFVTRLAPRVLVTGGELGPARPEAPLNPEKVRIWQKTGTKIFSTSADGATSIESNGTELRIRTYKGAEALVVNGGKNSKTHN